MFTFDSSTVKFDSGYYLITGFPYTPPPPTIPEAGWPCALLPSTPPGVDDQLSRPTAASMLPQVTALTPRGAAWGTDEYGDGTGAAPVQRRFWSALGGFAADLYTSVFNVAVQSFPSAIDNLLPEWELELGLPDTCLSVDSGSAGRIRSVRAKHQAIGGSSIGYFYCLALSIGYNITISEIGQFTCDFSECDGPDEVSYLNLYDTWIVSAPEVGLEYFRPDQGMCDDTPLESFAVLSDLECLFRRNSPVHTTLIFNYA